nr:hypothetical protein [Tanacetum cinerariifolium]
MTSIQTFLEKFNCIPFEEKPQILFQTWETFFAIQSSQPEDSNELFKKILKELKELAEYDQSTRTDHPIFLNGDEGHSNEIADLEPEATTGTELSGTEDIHPLAVQEPPQDSDICQLINECCEEVLEQQKQNMEKTILDLVKICNHKQFLCIHDDVDDLIQSALDSKLLSINLINSQCLDKKEQEVKNVEEQPAERRNRTEKALQNFRVVHKSSISLKDTSQISSIHEDNDDLDEDVPAKEFKVYSNPLCDEEKINSDKLDSHCFNIESDFVESLLNRDTSIDFSLKIDFSGELFQKSNFDFEEEIRLYNSFPRPPKELKAEIADTIIESIPLPIPVQDGNSQ